MFQESSTLYFLNILLLKVYIDKILLNTNILN